MRISCLVVGALLGLSVAACDSARERVADAIRPKSADDVATAVDLKLDQKKYAEAKAEGEAYMNGGHEGNGRLSWDLAKACAQLGQPELALRYAKQALDAGAVSPMQAMSDPLMEPLRTDIRFVSLLASGGSQQVTDTGFNSAGNAPPLQAASSSTSVQLGSGGISARAGDLTVKLPE